MLSGNLIVATPTLIRRLPQPLQIVVGDLSEKERLIVGLDPVPPGTVIGPKRAP